MLTITVKNGKTTTKTRGSVAEIDKDLAAAYQFIRRHAEFTDGVNHQILNIQRILWRICGYNISNDFFWFVFRYKNDIVWIGKIIFHDSLNTDDMLDIIKIIEGVSDQQNVEIIFNNYFITGHII